MSLGNPLNTDDQSNAHKLTFQRLNIDKSMRGDPVSVDYNPKELAFTKRVNYADIAIPGLDVAPLQFVRGDAETVGIELLFDTTSSGMGATAVSVVDKFKSLYGLVKIDGDMHTPPIVRISWGDKNIGYLPNAEDGTAQANVFDAVVLSVDRKFLLFTSTGTPVRAVITMALKEYRSVAEQVAAINFRSPDHTRIYTVREGDNLPSIAAEKYGDPARWRTIAEHNGIRNVRQLTPGLQLELPPLR
ncbi:LysM peptidoglycan-binding domain-containing protein [Pleionea sp. CnH1-48]|uniref:CIS tube protein n=1 Tax=Pleionea sp. CnH1-48 TaxID=2954494 RepID=UPI002096A0A8|nr:LysM peptidoglycan-binding domain-containing protein [Pleionea sp. CnH1-48]MCO7223328.1 LysM peptidoglycan-binding domain-containing protein [Pleionea sp. CnH1-48]